MLGWKKLKHNCMPSATKYNQYMSLYKDAYRLKGKGWKVSTHANTNQKKIRRVILISSKIESEKGLVSDKEKYYVIIKGSII